MSFTLNLLIKFFKKKPSWFTTQFRWECSLVIHWSGDSSNCSSPAAVNTVRERIAKHIGLWLSQCNKPSVGYGSLPL